MCFFVFICGFVSIEQIRNTQKTLRKHQKPSTPRKTNKTHHMCVANYGVTFMDLEQGKQQIKLDQLNLFETDRTVSLGLNRVDKLVVNDNYHASRNWIILQSSNTIDFTIMKNPSIIAKDTQLDFIGLSYDFSEDVFTKTQIQHAPFSKIQISKAKGPVHATSGSKTDVQGKSKVLSTPQDLGKTSKQGVHVESGGDVDLIPTQQGTAPNAIHVVAPTTTQDTAQDESGKEEKEDSSNDSSRQIPKKTVAMLVFLVGVLNFFP